MRLVHASAVAVAVALLIPAIQASSGHPQAAAPAPAQDTDRKVAGGGITAKGWQGKVDANNKQGLTINDSKFAPEGGGFHITTGPATTYWNPANTAKGDYSVKATFREPKQTYNHPHPFGVFIAGKGLDTDQPSMLYCVAYRDGTFLVRQFGGGTVTTVAKKAPNDAVAKASGPEAEVTQEVGWNVKGGKADCVINGKVVYSTDPATVKLDSTDGIYGIRTTHNSDVFVTNFGMGK
jgi:hypothetical protein